MTKKRKPSQKLLNQIQFLGSEHLGLRIPTRRILVLRALNEKYGTQFVKPKTMSDANEILNFLLAKMDGKEYEFKKTARKKKAITTKKIFAQTDAFLESWEWTELRFEILKKFGRECMLCGSTEKICVDHIKPRSKYPELALDFDNLQVLCHLCNKGKSNRDQTDFRPKEEPEDKKSDEERELDQIFLNKLH